MEKNNLPKNFLNIGTTVYTSQRAPSATWTAISDSRDKTNVENIPGTGLGLSIMKLFMEMHGGEIIIDSAVNSGTSVRLILPLQNG